MNHHAFAVVPYLAGQTEAAGQMPNRRPKADALHHAAGADRQPRHQQMRGNCSPTGQSTMRRPPKAVIICTK